MYKSLVKNSAIYGVVPQLPKLVSFFILPLITPFLTKVDYGILGTLVAYIGAVSVLQFLGLDVAIYNAYYRFPSQYKWYWRQIFGFVSLWSIPYVVILGLVLYFVLPPEAEENKWLIIILKVIPPLFFRPGEIITYANYLLKQKALPIALTSFTVGTIGIGLSYYFIAHLRLGYMGWVYSDFVIESLGGLLFLIPLYTKWKLTPILNFKWRLIKNALKFSLPIVPHNYATYMLDSSDRLIMERLNVSTANIGRYSLAYSFGKYADTITSALNQAIAPNLLLLIKEKKWQTYKDLIYAFQSFVLIMCFTISLWTPQWLPVLIRNEELLDIEYLVVVVLMSYSYRPMYIGCNQLAFYYEKTGVLWKITFVAGLLNIILNLIFIPFFGLMAAAVITFISFMFMGFTGFTFKHYTDIKELDLKPLRWLMLITGLLFISLISLNIDWLYKIAVNLGIIVILLKTGGFKAKVNKILQSMNYRFRK